MPTRTLTIFIYIYSTVYGTRTTVDAVATWLIKIHSAVVHLTLNIAQRVCFQRQPAAQNDCWEVVPRRYLCKHTNIFFIRNNIHPTTYYTRHDNWSLPSHHFRSLTRIRCRCCHYLWRNSRRCKRIRNQRKQGTILLYPFMISFPFVHGALCFGGETISSSYVKGEGICLWLNGCRHSSFNRKIVTRKSIRQDSTLFSFFFQFVSITLYSWNTNLEHDSRIKFWLHLTVAQTATPCYG